MCSYDILKKAIKWKAVRVWAQEFFLPICPCRKLKHETKLKAELLENCSWIGQLNCFACLPIIKAVGNNLSSEDLCTAFCHFYFGTCNLLRSIQSWNWNRFYAHKSYSTGHLGYMYKCVLMEPDTVQK